MSTCPLLIDFKSEHDHPDALVSKGDHHKAQCTLTTSENTNDDILPGILFALSISHNNRQHLPIISLFYTVTVTDNCDSDSATRNKGLFVTRPHSPSDHGYSPLQLFPINKGHDEGGLCKPIPIHCQGKYSGK